MLDIEQNIPRYAEGITCTTINFGNLLQSKKYSDNMILKMGPP